MKKKYFSFIALILVFVMFLIAAGCGVRINGKEYEFYKSNQSEKKNGGIFSGIGQETSESQEYTQDKAEGEELKVKTNAGNVDITKNNGSGIIVNADKKVRGTSEEAKKTILENMIVSLEKSGDRLEVVVKTKDGKDFWDWQKENYRTYQITINYDIEVPEGVKSLNISTGAGNVNVESLAEKVKISTGAGNITINEMTALFDLSTGAGNIDISGSSAKGDCKLSTGAGNVNFEGNIDSVDEFDASTGMGNLDFTVPGETKMSLEASTGVGALSGSFVRTNEDSKFRYKGDINGGGPSVKLSTGVGNVAVDED